MAARRLQEIVSREVAIRSRRWIHRLGHSVLNLGHETLAERVGRLELANGDIGVDQHISELLTLQAGARGKPRISARRRGFITPSVGDRSRKIRAQFCPDRRRVLAVLTQADVELDDVAGKSVSRLSNWS
jgi:hypothetical protein